MIDIPEFIDDKSRDLGDPIARFESSTLQKVLYLVFGVLAVLLGLACGIFLIVVLIDPPDKLRGIFRLGAFAFVSLAAGVGMLVKWRAMLGAGVIAFEQGLARFKGRDCETMRFKDIQVVRRGKPKDGNDDVTIGTPMRLTLEGTDGREWVLTESLSGLKELRDIVEERTLRYLLPEALLDLEEGKNLSFGDVGLGPDGLQVPDKAPLPWERLGDVEIDRGKVVIGLATGKGPYCRLRIYQVPNAHVLQAVVEQIRSE
jgi:hypothetical protein